MKFKELLQEGNMEPTFNEYQVQDIENKLSDLLNDSVEILSVSPSASCENAQYCAQISFDGLNGMGGKGFAYFNCVPQDTYVEDFELVNLTGNNFASNPLN